MVRNPWGSTYKTSGTWGEGVCTSDADFTDSYGDDCSWYDDVPSDCGVYDTTTDVSADSCCACGGGTTVDNENWTTEYLAQVPYGVDPLTSASDDGVFFVDSDEFLTCFDDFNIAHYRNSEGYTDNWYDHWEDTSGASEDYTITTASDQTGDLYFTVETYYLGQVSYFCQFFGSTPFASWKLYQNGVLLSENDYWEYFTEPVLVEEGSYTAGDEFTVEVDYDWYGFNVNDYTVKVYSTSELEVQNAAGELK